MKINRLYPQTSTVLNDYGPLVKAFLSEQIQDNETLEMILDDNMRQCYHPSLDDAISFIHEAKQSQEPLFICGDYDCDGMTSTAMLVYLLEKLGFNSKQNLGFFIPNRLSNGYGASQEIVRDAYDKGYRRFIFLDNGVKAHEAINYLHAHDCPLLIIDHHTIEEPLENVTLFHPVYLEAHFQNMCAAGLVYVLSQKLELNDNFLISLAAIGTIGDVMPLTHFNRIMVKQGLKVLNQNAPRVISALLKNPTIKIDTTIISFQIVPVFNAVGRLADRANANQVVRYLLSKNEATILNFSKQMLDLNATRKKLSQQQQSLALGLVSEHPFNVIYDEQFHEGLVGIVAGQLARSTSKPTLVMTRSGDIIKGSARSHIFNVYEFLSQFSHYYDSFGGHAQACAIAMPADYFSDFRKSVNGAMAEIKSDEPIVQALQLDSSDFRESYFEQLNTFAPFGQGFDLMDVIVEAPVLKTINLGTVGIKWVIDGYHDLVEIVYFGSDFNKYEKLTTICAVGKLQAGYRSGLSLNASVIVGNHDI